MALRTFGNLLGALRVYSSQSIICLLALRRRPAPWSNRSAGSGKEPARNFHSAIRVSTKLRTSFQIIRQLGDVSVRTVIVYTYCEGAVRARWKFRALVRAKSLAS